MRHIIIKQTKKTLSEGPSAHPRPLHISKMAKVYIVKWSQNLIFDARSSISGLTKVLIRECETGIFLYFW